MVDVERTGDLIMLNAVKKLVGFYDQVHGGGVGTKSSAAWEGIVRIVKIFMEDFPEIDDENVIFRCCRNTVKHDYNLVTKRYDAKKLIGTIIVKSSLKESELRGIFELLKATFFDLAFFDSLIGEKLWLFLQHSNSFEITESSTRNCVERYYDVETFDDPTKPERKLVLNQIRLVFKCCTVLLLGYHPLLRSYRWTSVDELIRQYPDFAEVKERQELQYLLAFRNIVRVALLVIPPLSNKQLLLNIGGRLEGSGNEYITGTGQKICVTRRVAIYEQEGRVTSQKKKPKTQQLSQLVQPQTQSQQQQKLEQSTSSGSASNANGTGSNNREYESSSIVKRNDVNEPSQPTLHAAVGQHAAVKGNDNQTNLQVSNSLGSMVKQGDKDQQQHQEKVVAVESHQKKLPSRQPRPPRSLEQFVKGKFMSSNKVKRIRLAEQDIQELSKPAPLPISEMMMMTAPKQTSVAVHPTLSHKNPPFCSSGSLVFCSSSSSSSSSSSAAAVDGGQPAPLHAATVSSGDQADLTRCHDTGDA